MCVCVGVSNSAFHHLMEFTYTATLALSGQEEVVDVWRAAEYLQMQEAIKALNNRFDSTSMFSCCFFGLQKECTSCPFLNLLFLVSYIFISCSLETLGFVFPFPQGEERGQEHHGEV